MSVQDDRQDGARSDEAIDSLDNAAIGDGR